MGTDGSADDLVLTGLLAAFRDMQVQYTRVLSQQQDAFNLDLSRTRALFFLASRADTGATSKALGEFLGLTSGAMTNLIDRAMDDGLVEKSANPADRRSILLRPTSAGINVVDTIAKAFRSALSGAVALEDISEATRLFRTVEAALAHAVTGSADHG